MSDNFDADGHHSFRKLKGVLIQINPADCFESIQKGGDFLRRNFGLQKFPSLTVLPLDDPGVDLAEALFDLPDGNVRISDLNRQVNG